MPDKEPWEVLVKIAQKTVGVVAILCLAIGSVALYGLSRSSNEIERIGGKILPTVESLLVTGKSLESIAKFQQILINPYVDARTKERTLDEIELQLQLIGQRLPERAVSSGADGTEGNDWQEFRKALDEWKACHKKVVELYGQLSESGIQAPESLRAKLSELQAEGRLWTIALASTIMERKDFLWEVDATDSEMWAWSKGFSTENKILSQLIGTELGPPMDRLYSSGAKVVEIFERQGKTDESVAEASEVFRAETVAAERELASVFDRARAETQRVRELYAQIRAQSMGAGTASMEKAQSILNKLIERHTEASATAVHSARKTAWRLTAVTAGCAILAVIIGIIVTRGITGPFIQGVEFALSVQRGDLSKRLTVRTSDEAGQLASALNDMAEDLTTQNNLVQEGVGVLVSVAEQLGRAASELVAGASQALSAVSETTTTVEEVRRSAKVCSEQAKHVSDVSREAVNISESGRAATSENVGRINLIKEQMESIGHAVVSLSGHTEAIEEITATVQDLADQSKLLAVNASIEAALAGDRGKGFAVVALEIKSLSDQSREATDQVHKILQNIRNSVNAVVMATEQGSKAVQSGVEQSIAAGQSIEELASSVASSAQAANVIDSTTEQQFVGMDQVAGAMGNIEQTVRQYLDRASGLQAVAGRLTEVGDQLTTLMARYRVDADSHGSKGTTNREDPAYSDCL